MAKGNSASRKPFALLVDPAPAIAAAKRLAAHLPPYGVELLEDGEDQPEREFARQN